MPAGKRAKGKETGVKTDFRDLLVCGCASLGVELETAAVERLHLYHQELIRWSRKINLIAKETDERTIIENHFLDSLTLLSQFGERVHLLDVGTGAGFPGLVCKAARPEILLTLVEPRLKRVSFLRHIQRTLKMEDVSVVAGRIEDEASLPSSSSFSHITGRAVTDVGTFLAMIARFIRKETEIICMKGPKWRQELEQASGVIRDLGLRVDRTTQLELPFSGAHRTLLVLKILAKSG
jgi:16S rRNA (guanine527-N7)-methyltransferase